MNPDQFIKECLRQGIQLSDRQMKQFLLYFKLLVEWNQKVNLTAITQQEEVFLKHFFDSLTAAFYFPLTDKGLSLCDVGAGAGFPSIPLKIVFPDLKVTIVDSLNKRILFLQELTKQLQLKDIQLFHDRAETFGQDKKQREKYDIVTARAVANLSVLTEYCLPLTKINGHFLALKGADGRKELAEADQAIRILGGKLEHLYEFQLPAEESERTIMVIKKVKMTPKKYPRKPGIPAKIPL